MQSLFLNRKLFYWMARIIKIQEATESEGQVELDPVHDSEISQLLTANLQTVVEGVKVVEFIQQVPVHGTHPN